jgi:hypothetical protein
MRVMVVMMVASQHERDTLWDDQSHVNETRPSKRE